ncbi:Aryl-alcohol-oxidase from pleurotus Eryingii [Mycena sanguinolenta]|uniref:Aryl-alcohol-oxidase from pleurotus Eryingii n=1 Tax=Mycena sanguinolenta TaxID=230812 RepID=A0A8H6XQ34_9AGAR|nr:Aryl-alcohol-oxidase from pleurotus Eryingii [Mycena sanguinolenta]
MEAAAAQGDVMRLKLTILLQLTLSRLGNAAIYNSFEDLPIEDFDFIIIGGGAGGNVVANRLTENPAFSVLLLEAGPSPAGLINYTAPFFSIYLRQPGPFDWNYTLTSSGLNDRVITYPRGRILGGCTSINGLGYLRGSQEDFNRYASVSGDLGWGWDALQPYFRKNERWTRPTDNHKQSGQFNPIYHGFHGINAVSLSGFPVPVELNDRVAETIQELGNDFPFNEDPNSGFPVGTYQEAWAQSNIKHGFRSSSFTSYLAEEFIARPNLHVVLNAQATRILQTEPMSFRTVEFASARNAPRQTLTAYKEVIIAAGSLETPKLLMNSGIGDPDYLSSMNITPLVSLPDVGKNLSVHIAVSLVYNVNTTRTFDEIVRNATLRDALTERWLDTNGTGPLGIPYISHVVTKRLPSDAAIFQNTTDPAAGPNSPHLHTTIQNGDINVTPSGFYLSLPATLLTPRGTIQLTSNAPFDPPLIDMASLTTPFDIFGLREAVKMTHRFLSAHSVPSPLNASNTEIETYLRQNAAPNGHVVGTASMAPVGASWGVVDPDLRVKGVKGLRIVDASVLPYVPTGYTMTTTYMIAERGSDLIKAAWD